MSLAAQFPLKPTSYNTQDKVNANIVGEEATVPILSPAETIKWREVAEHQQGDDTTRTKRSLTEAQSQSSEELILSQDSFDSSITQVARGIRSCSGSNSEAEDPSIGWKPNNIQVSSLTDYLRMEKTISVQEVHGHENGCTVFNEKYQHGEINYGQLKSSFDAMKHIDFPSSTYTDNAEYLYIQPALHSGNNELCMTANSRAPEVCCFETLSEESTCSWHSAASRSAKGPDAVLKSSRSAEPDESFGNSSEQQNELWKSQETPTADALQSNIEYSRSSCNSYQHGKNNAYQVENNSLTKPVKLVEALTKMQNATEENVQNANKHIEITFETGDSISAVSTQIPKEHKLVEPNTKEQSSSSDHAHNAANVKISKAKKGNSAGQKKNRVDWDILRKQVETSGAKKERRKDTMDSLDYEALRTADVKEISDAIKERGMNNMLAERIKVFP